MNGTLVIALGNRQRGDDAVGPLVADRLVARAPGVEVLEGALDPMALVNAWEGRPSVIVVDAASSGAPPGTIHRPGAHGDPLPKEIARCSSHGGGLAEALALARALGRSPPALRLYAIEAASCEAGEPLSPRVAAALEDVVDSVLAALSSAP